MPDAMSSDDAVMSGLVSDLSAEDAKLATLARGALSRVGAPEGAAVRDETGRTYAAATVSLPSLQLTALQLAVAQAVAAGARQLEAVAVVSASETLDAVDVSVAQDLGGDAVMLYLVSLDGAAYQLIPA